MRGVAMTHVLLACLLTAVVAPRIAAEDAYLLVITGVAGDDEHVKAFHTWAITILDAAKKRDGVPDANIRYLADKPDVDPARITGRSTKENVEKTVAELAARTQPNDQVFLLLIGHGSFDGKTAAFNLPGPDLTSSEWATLLGAFKTARVAFINTSSASGAFLPALAAPGRTVVTATKTGGERNEPRFAQFFVEAYADETADLDRDGRVSVFEAFTYARTKVVKSYEQAGTLLTEHAAMDDGADGKLAGTMFLASSAAAMKVDASDPVMRALVSERDAIDKKVSELKIAKDAMPPARYEQELERLLTELALKTRAIRELQAKKP